MKNLLQETEEELERRGLSSKDVLWVGSQDLYTDWVNFVENADVEYDASYGTVKVANDLLVVGVDWWLERHEYYGSEWWEFKKLPTMPIVKKHIKSFIREQYEGGLKELVEGEK